MNKLFMIFCMSVLVAGISTIAHSGPSHYTQAEFEEWAKSLKSKESPAERAEQQRNLNPRL